MELSHQLIKLSAQPLSKDEALQQLVQLFSEAGYVDPAYLEGMRERETQANTYLDNGIAIPHGTPESRHLIHQTGIAVLQAPHGVDWGEGETARLIIGIAAANDEHLQILRRLTRVLGDEDLVQSLLTTSDKNTIIAALMGIDAPAEQAPDNELLPYSAVVKLPNPQGMHARPATMLAGMVKKAGAQVKITRTDNGRSGDATKLMELLSLGLTKGTELKVSTDKEALLPQLIDAIGAGLGDDLTIQTTAPIRRAAEWVPQQVGATLEGVAAADGLVFGLTRQHIQKALVVTDQQGTDPAEQAAELDRAIEQADRDLETMMREVEGKFGADKAAIFGAHREMLRDEGTLSDTVNKILDGHSAAWAYQQATAERITQLQKLDDPLLAARAVDLSDVQRRVLRSLLGIHEDQNPQGEPVILLAPDLTPSDTARLGTDTILGFATAQGGPTSHTAIIARGLGLPAIVAAGDGILDIPDGTPALLDGSAGYLYLNPSEADIISAKDRMRVLAEAREAARAARHLIGATADGIRVEIAANINRAADAAGALDSGAEGVGLMRTEFLFLERDSIPTEADQEKEYRAMAAALGDKPLIIRTLDIGGDKEVPYLGLAHEDNSFLGIRGIRLCFERPDLFLPQLRAIVRVARDHSNVHVMFPMISTLEDFRRARNMLDEVRTEMNAPHIPLGVMIEVPSAALMAEQLAPEVDFFSIGTNDLTQYTLAMDRMHAQLARQTDAMHPAVLRLIDLTVKAAQYHGKWVGVCGGAAGDDVGSLVLAGLGVKELSVSTPQIAGVKANLRKYQSITLQTLAQEALLLPDARAVRDLVASRLKEQRDQA